MAHPLTLAYAWMYGNFKKKNLSSLSMTKWLLDIFSSLTTPRISGESKDMYYL
jgi:hypothetical protein